MKKSFFFTCAFIIFITGCFKDDCKSIQHLYKPVYKSLADIRKEMTGGAAQPVKTAGKIYIWKNYIFLNEPNKGIHVINNSNPAFPKNVSFIPIAGNYDIAVQGNYLYADSYRDLAVFDISNAEHAVLKKIKKDVFIYQASYYYTNGDTSNLNTTMVAVDYTTKDTMVDCSTSNPIPVFDNNCTTCMFLSANAYYQNAPKTATGTGGSEARFTILNNYLYTVDVSNLYSFSLANAGDPQYAGTTFAAWAAETIFPFENKLLIGSQNGVSIFNVDDPAQPVSTGFFGHVEGCDPVIADGDYAFVTISTNAVCSGEVNELDVLDISSGLYEPPLVEKYNLENPKGLAKSGNLLFVCDDGLKVYDATDVKHLALQQHVNNIEANDVILFNKTALVVAANGLYQYDFSSPSNLKLLSKISTEAK